MVKKQPSKLPIEGSSPSECYNVYNNSLITSLRSIRSRDVREKAGEQRNLNSDSRKYGYNVNSGPFNIHRGDIYA